MSEKKIRYFDHAASSWPKPPSVVEAMAKAVQEYGANPGRGSHTLGVKASRVLFETRANLAKLCGIRNPNLISFALNTTMALNTAIMGIVKPGDHVICTSIEHNSVRRPLEYLKQTCGVEITYLEADVYGAMLPDRLEQAFRPDTKLLVINHSSNLLGTIYPAEEMTEIAHRYGAVVLLDAAQTLGMIPIRVEEMGIDMMAFPGHKGLLGPQGTGGLYIRDGLEVEPLLRGGTGSQSENIEQPSVRPDRYESGTQNTPGIAGLNEGVKFVLAETVERIYDKEAAQVARLVEGLNRIGGIRVLGPQAGVPRTGIASFTMKGADSSEVAFILDQSYGIAVRSGFHCTPLAHTAAGTTENGAVRASIGYYTSEDDIEYFLKAVEEIASHY